ncbi:MAG: PAS domain S-box protein, partial [Burkholderiaceae bacterium]|nr:PAS domain S-box protein [Burkholderiaceae bacterium]
MSAIAARCKHLSLRQRFLIAPLLGCLLLVLLLAAFVYDSQRQNSLLNDIAKHRLSAVDRYSEVFADLATQHIALHELLSRTGGLDEESFYVQAKARLNAIHAAIGGIEEILRADPPARREAAAVLALHRDLAGLMEQYRRTVTAAVEIKTVNLAIATSMRANQRFSAMSAAFSRLLKYQRGGLESDIADGVKHSRASTMALSAGALLGAILLLFLSMGLSRMLSRSLDQQIQTLVEIGGGEAGDDLERDEVGRIGRAIDSFKRTQLALRESEQRFRLFFERNDVIMLLIDPDSGAIQDANQAAARFYGHVRARLRRMDMRDIEAEAGLAPGCAGHPTILRHRLADGALRFVEVSATPVEAAGKTLLFSIVHDITERRRAEEQLRLLNQELERRIEERTLALWSEKSLLRSIIDTLPDMISVKNHAGAYLACNRTFARGVIGLAESEVVGRGAAELQAAALVAQLRGLELQVLATGAVHREERWVGLVDGRRALMESVIAPLHDYDGKITGTVEIGHDITERNEREEALREARLAADAANRAKSAFLATMSHEIRTPINGVIGMVEVLAQSRLSEHQSDALKTVRDSAFLLLSVIDDILDFSKIEAGRMELERVQVSITEIVEGICNSLLPVASAKGVDLTLFISPLVPAQVWSDPTRLRQVLYNLMGNAIKFSGGRAGLRGRVAVRVELAEGEPRRLRFRIADNGIGMSAETQANLFTPFTQGEVSTIRRFGGTGLGLVISQRLLNLMQGETLIDSALGVGTTFTVTLPVEAVDGAGEPGLPDLGGLDCIIVAGSLFDPGDLRIYLEHAGARVRDADD